MKTSWILYIQCKDSNCNKLTPVEALTPSEIHGSKIECDSCGSIIYIDLIEMESFRPSIVKVVDEDDIPNDNKNDRVNFEEINLLRAKLGQYKLGTFRPSSDMISLSNKL